LGDSTTTTTSLTEAEVVVDEGILVVEGEGIEISIGLRLREISSRKRR